MVAERVWREWLSAAPSEPPCVLDPACGAGALLHAFLHTCPADRVRPDLHGVDCDRSALAQASSEGNFHWGDALTGPAFGEPREPIAEPQDSRVPPSLDWTASFPAVAARGGFDIVLANPPYIRERMAKSMFRELARTPLGSKYSEGRMDLWYYFLHRGLDLAAPGGLLAYLVPSFWLGGIGARKVRARLRDEARIVEVALFERWPIFPEVFGRHLLLLARKRPWESSAVRRLSPVGQPPKFRASKIDECWLPTAWREEIVPVESLFGSPPASNGLARRSATLVGEAFEVRQGIAENPPRITKPLSAKFDHAWPIGTGVFVLYDAELAALELSDAERAFARPYYATRALARYRLPTVPTDWLLYVTKHNVPDIHEHPNLARHLARFRPLLEQRREVQRGQLPWWGLHWPREERLFVAPRLLVPQMGERPRAVFVERPAFAGFSTNVIVAPPGSPVAETELRALCGALNSRVAERWFERHAKRRGVGYDIGGMTLRNFPWRVCQYRGHCNARPTRRRATTTRTRPERNSDARSPRAGRTDRNARRALVCRSLTKPATDCLPPAIGRRPPESNLRRDGLRTSRWRQQCVPPDVRTAATAPKSPPDR